MLCACVHACACVCGVGLGGGEVVRVHEGTRRVHLVILII